MAVEVFMSSKISTELSENAIMSSEAMTSSQSLRLLELRLKYEGGNLKQDFALTSLYPFLSERSSSQFILYHCDRRNYE
jgi:hypothetical protein